MLPARIPRSERLPTCPPHLNPAAAAEWRRIAKALQRAGVFTIFDRAALAAYCQAYGRWVEAEQRLKGTPPLVKTPSGYVQQSPWLGIVHKQLELMGRYMVELGLTPAARSRMTSGPSVPLGYVSPVPIEIRRVIVDPVRADEPGRVERATRDWATKHCADG